MGEYMVWIWLIVFIITLILEFITADFVTIWFAISAIPTVIVAWIFPDIIWLQVVIFFVLGFALMLMIRSYLLRYFKRNVISTNADSYVGKIATVTEKITPLERGLVLFEGTTWTAVSQDVIEEGQNVRILAIEGNKFIVTNIE